MTNDEIPDYLQGDALIDDVEALQSMADERLINELEELIGVFQEQADKVSQGEKATEHGQAHANGVACGMDWCADELEEVIEQYE
jgi:hypothetical protein